MAGDGFTSLFCMRIFKGTRYGASGDGFREKSISSVNCEVPSPVCLRVQMMYKGTAAIMMFQRKSAEKRAVLRFFH